MYYIGQKLNCQIEEHHFVSSPSAETFLENEKSELSLFVNKAIARMKLKFQEAEDLSKVFRDQMELEEGFKHIFNTEKRNSKAKFAKSITRRSTKWIENISMLSLRILLPRDGKIFHQQHPFQRNNYGNCILMSTMQQKQGPEKCIQRFQHLKEKIKGYSEPQM